MARPQKKAIDYFPLDCSLDDSVKFIEAKHGLSGFAVLIKLWSKVYASEGYYCYWDEKSKYLFCKENGIEVSEIESILDTCFFERIFHKELFDQHKILTSSGIQRRYFKIVKEARRKDVEINESFYLLEVNSCINSINSDNNSVNSGNTPAETTQRKEKESKVKKRKEKGDNSEAPNLDNEEVEISEEREPEKEKSSAKKEKLIVEKCKDQFLSKSGGYFWEEQDSEALNSIIVKIRHAFGVEMTDEDVEQNFCLFIDHLPKYWRTKKFTLPLLNRNFNEIINEIQTKNTNGAKEKFGRHSINDLANRASTFGR